MNQPAQDHQHPGRQQTPFQMMATRLSVDPETVQNLMTQTLMKAKGGQQQVTHEELMVFMSIANEYRLNPLAKEIYAFNNRGAIQPIVSIDGWLKIINTHPQFDGMEFDDKLDNQGGLLAITCRIFRKDRSRATEVTEYLNECRDQSGKSEPWKKWPVRMLRHKATIQCARYAFGLSGIIDEDEADRYRSTNLERDVTPPKEEPQALPFYPAEQFDDNFPTWQAAIEAGKRTPEQVIGFLTSKAQLTDEQKQQIQEVKA
ncbi:phage recombination protein Bet [Halomonas sp. V046]|uniref:phage recombination protein Bet n=1 Tax=Halomonas sp. V046 TaxID=3459611 RepID=UPI004044A67F